MRLIYQAAAVADCEAVAAATSIHITSQWCPSEPRVKNAPVVSTAADIVGGVRPETAVPAQTTPIADYVEAFAAGLELAAERHTLVTGRPAAAD